MKTVILCGGKGTRLRELTDKIPKPLVEVGGRPILWHIMKVYSSQGYNDFVLALGYKGELIRSYFENNPHDFNIEFVDTGLETNTGGRIKKAAQHIDGEFMATYGDGLSNIEFKKLADFHKKHNSIATITCVMPRSQFGIVDIDEQEKVIAFREKTVLPYWVNGGFFVFKKE